MTSKQLTGKRLKQILSRHQLKIEQLAEIMGVARNTVSRKITDYFKLPLPLKMVTALRKLLIENGYERSEELLARTYLLDDQILEVYCQDVELIRDDRLRIAYGEIADGYIVRLPNLRYKVVELKDWEAFLESLEPIGESHEV